MCFCAIESVFFFFCFAGIFEVDTFYQTICKWFIFATVHCTCTNSDVHRSKQSMPLENRKINFPLFVVGAAVELSNSVHGTVAGVNVVLVQ